jgi:nucleoside-diphosphate-sugar epimerase
MCPDISKAKNLLGYQPKYTPEQSLYRAVEWMKSNKML